MQPLARELEDLGDAEERNSWQLPELRAFHYRAVQRIYGEQGNQMLRLLREHPAVTLPVVLQRLQQKDAEWRRVGEGARVGWTPGHSARRLWGGWGRGVGGEVPYGLVEDGLVLVLEHGGQVSRHGARAGKAQCIGRECQADA